MKQQFAGKLIETLVKTLPPRQVYSVAAAISGAFLRGKTKRLLEDTKALFPEKSDDWVRDAVKRQRHHRAWVAVDKYMLTKLEGKDIVKMHAPASVERIRKLADEAFAPGKGVIVYTLHYGRPSWSPVLFAELGYPYIGLMRGSGETGLQEQHAESVRARGAKLLEAGDFASGVYALRGLKENRALFVLIDGRLTQRPTVVDFLGQKVPFSLGFAQLARRTGSRLLAGVTTTGSNPTELHIDGEFVDLPDEDLSPEEIGKLLVAPLERMVVKDIGQWYGINRLFRQARRVEHDAGLGE